METSTTPLDNGLPATEGAADYWAGLINKKAAAVFLSVKEDTLDAWRQRGGGPPYVRISSRCLRYRRVDLKAWADSRQRRSTSDPGPEAA